MGAEMFAEGQGVSMDPEVQIRRLLPEMCLRKLMR